MAFMIGSVNLTPRRARYRTSRIIDLMNMSDMS